MRSKEAIDGLRRREGWGELKARAPPAHRHTPVSRLAGVLAPFQDARGSGSAGEAVLRCVVSQHRQEAAHQGAPLPYQILLLHPCCTLPHSCTVPSRSSFP